MEFKKQISLLLFLMFGLSVAQAQQHQFQLIDAADHKAIVEADIFYNQALITRTQNGFFSISDQILPALFTIKSDGYSELAIRLEPKSGSQKI